MPAVLLFLVQAAAGPGDGRPAIADPERQASFRITSPSECPAEDRGEIVVCGSRGQNERYRARPMPPGYERGPLRAEIGLGEGTVGGIHVESVELPNGVTSKRLMLSIKTRF